MIEEKKFDINSSDEIVAKSNTITNGTPRFKIEHFVGNSELTPYKKMRQFLVEIQIRQDSYLNIENALAKAKVQLEIEEEKLKVAPTELEKKYCALEIFNLKKDIKKYEFNRRQALQEKDDFVKCIQDLHNSDKGKLEDGTPLLEVFGNKELEEKLEKEYWIIRLAKQASNDLLATGKIQSGNLDALAMLDSKDHEQALQLVCDKVVRHDGAMQLMYRKAYESAAQGLTDQTTKTRLLSMGISDTMKDDKIMKETLSLTQENIINSNSNLEGNSDTEFEMLTNEDNEEIKKVNNG